MQHPDFFTSYALQSGQHYSTRPPWQVAGVDFPVGAPPDGLRDPLAAGVLPAGCKYLPNRNWVFCSGPDVTLDRLDFSLHDCMQAVFDPRVTGTVTVSNSKFADGPGCESGPGSSLVVSAGVTSANLVFSGNDVDGKAGDLQTWTQCNPVGKCMSHNVMWRTSGSVTIENNAFLNTAARAVEAEVGVSVVYRGNYVEGIWGNTAHAEFQLANSAARHDADVPSCQQHVLAAPESAQSIGLWMGRRDGVPGAFLVRHQDAKRVRLEPCGTRSSDDRMARFVRWLSHDRVEHTELLRLERRLRMLWSSAKAGELSVRGHLPRQRESAQQCCPRHRQSLLLR